MGESLAFFQGKVVKLDDAKVGIMTHALHYGTSVFEGIRGNWNKEKSAIVVFRLREHYDRMLRGCKILCIDLPYNTDDLVDITLDLIQKCGYKEDIYIRPLAYKSEEKVANLKLHELGSDFTLMIVPFGNYIDNEKPIKCQTSSWRRPDDSMMPTGVKLSGLYTTSILAKTEAIMAGFDEAILLNHDGSVSEGSGENLFMVNGKEIITPAETENCLLGITRDCVFEIAKNELNIDISSRKIHRSEIYLADEVFLTGTAAHITSVGYLDNREIGNGEVGALTKELQSIYFKIVRGSNNNYKKWCTAVNL
ncbi:MAG: branched chain amino acid aminotransferase [Dehalococcoidia bacterium]|nr:branched chain amino acid aminotransferase [Dehalococcoidia bacterium]